MAWMDELKSAEGLQAALVQHGPRLAVGILAALLAVQAGFIVTSQNRGVGAGASPTGGAGTASGAMPAASVPATAPALRVNEITSAHLFGEAHGAANDANAPPTTVQLVLAGVLALPDPKRGLAILGPSAAAAKLYAVGSAVPGGVNLYAVYRDRVLLDRGGIIESLFLPRRAPLGGVTPAVESANRGSPAQRLAALAQGNGALMGGLIRAQAVFVGSKLSGYRIFPGGRTSVGAFTQLGLRPGDLITAVNGTPLDDPNRGSEILDTLSSQASATVTVQRNGQSMDLNLNLETVANDAENMSIGAARHAGAVGMMPGSVNQPPGAVGMAVPPEPVVAPDESDTTVVDDPSQIAPNKEE
jgi:general secretion pathway protein C